MKKFICAVLSALLLVCPALAAPAELTAVGRTVGIRLREDGVTVTGFAEGGHAEAAGIRAGDRILRINGTAVETAEDIAALTGSGEAVTVTVARGGAEAAYLVEPVAQDGRWLLGLRVRDSISGIGTVTYYDPESGAYGALGHGVCTPGSGDLLRMTGGEVVPSTVTGVERGRRGAAGQLLGAFDRSTALGTVEKNTDCGIFGVLRTGLDLGSACPVAAAGDLHPGAAVILASVAGTEAREYDVKILKLYPGESERNLLLEVTDPRLLAATGGIVQGMSGSPILQDGRLVGAVTHVLLADPARGYGISIGNMLKAAA